MSKTKISWTEKTWNPITGCTKVSQGCKNCYAEKMFKRLVAMESDDYMGRKFTDVKFHPDRLNDLARLRKPSMIFVNSMSDLFHSAITDQQIKSTFDYMEQVYSKHIFQILTKRPKRMFEIFSDHQFAKNIWLGVSGENQEHLHERAMYLKEMNCAVKIFSLEPLLAPINVDEYIMRQQVDWVIVGAESMGGAVGRECKIEWIENIVDQCKKSNMPVFVKQIHKEINGKLYLRKDIETFPKHLRVREYPKA